MAKRDANGVYSNSAKTRLVEPVLALLGLTQIGH